MHYSLMGENQGLTTATIGIVHFHRSIASFDKAA